MAWHPSNGNGKVYSSSDFRGSWCSDARDHGGPRRHMFDCELGAAAAAYSRGPRMDHDTYRGYASTMATYNNMHRYSSSTANDRDKIAANKVLQSAYSGDRVTLSSHEAAHIRAGAEWLNANRDSFSPGFVRSAANLYNNVYDSNGHKVVDGRMFRGLH
jgi:hypothetical protein